jgi:hypothetical protein
VTSTEELARLLDWTGTVEPTLTWAEAEAAVGFRFPADYRELLSTFPSGAFGERFYLYSPVAGPAHLEHFLDTRQMCLDVLAAANEDEPLRLFPEPGGLIPWGRGDEHEYCWDTSAGESPDDWTVTFHFREESGAYPGNASSFLADVLTGRYTDDLLFYRPDPAERRFADYELREA